MNQDPVLGHAFGTDFMNYYTRIKLADAARHEQAEDKLAFDQREFFSRI